MCGGVCLCNVEVAAGNALNCISTYAIKRHAKMKLSKGVFANEELRFFVRAEGARFLAQQLNFMELFGP